MSARGLRSEHVLYDPIHYTLVTIQADCRLHAEQILANRLGYGWVRIKGSRPRFMTVSNNIYKALYQQAFNNDFDNEDEFL